MDIARNKSSERLSLQVKALSSALRFEFFSFTITREVKIYNVCVSLILRLMQAIVLVYIIGYDIIQNKSYQSFEPVSSTITTKVKGIGYLNRSDGFYLINNNRIFLHKSNKTALRIFDTADYINPPTEYNSVFIMTNFIETQQTQDFCLEDSSNNNMHCQSDHDCHQIVHEFSNPWNGLPTGKCVTNIHRHDNQSVGLCEIFAWCPVLVESKRNIISNITNKYISSCKYDPIIDPNCPVLLVKDILETAEPDPYERSLMLIKGGVIQIEITWDCNLDYSVDDCAPNYSFSRYDYKLNNISPASGFNFRFAEKYEINNIKYRNLIKAFGLRFFIVVNGKAGKLDFIPLFLVIGAGIGLLAFPKLISDLILFNLTKNRKFYRKLRRYQYNNYNTEEE